MHEIIKFKILNVKCLMLQISPLTQIGKGIDSSCHLYIFKWLLSSSDDSIIP